MVNSADPEHYDMSHVSRKPAFCICENKDADQLRGNCEDRFSQNEAHMALNCLLWPICKRRWKLQYDVISSAGRTWHLIS